MSDDERLASIQAQKALKRRVNRSRRAIRILHDISEGLQEQVERQDQEIQQLKQMIRVLAEHRTA